MNKIWKKIVIYSLRQKGDPEDKRYSDYVLGKGYFEFRLIIFRLLRDLMFITIGIFSAAFGLKGFLLTNKFIDGGATGISLLVSALTNIPLPILIICINIPFVYLGFKFMGRSFAIKTALAISGLALVVATVHFPNITDDNILVSVFGGFFLGAGIGFSVRGGAVIDGTEVLAIYLSRKLGSTIGDVIIAINVIIFGAAAYFLTIPIALYSMITYLSASKTLDFIIEGIDEYTGITIISSHHVQIRQMIISQLGRGVTIYNGKGGFGKTGETREMDILFTVITRLELNKLNTEIAKIDPNAFIVTSSVKDTRGGMIKKKPLKH